MGNPDTFANVRHLSLAPYRLKIEQIIKQQIFENIFCTLFCSIGNPDTFANVQNKWKNDVQTNAPKAKVYEKFILSLNFFHSTTYFSIFYVLKLWTISDYTALLPYIVLS
jgi:hypothetical protein